MVKIAHYIIGAGLLMGAPAASAGDLVPDAADGIMNACRPDYHRMCSDVAPGSGRAARCLLGHQAELSPPCLRAVTIATSVEACMPDYQRHCPGVPSGAQAFQCLARRMEVLSPQCQRVVSANAPYMAQGREQHGYNPGPGSYGPGTYGYREGVPYGERYGYNQSPAPHPNGYSYREDSPGDGRYADEGEEPQGRPYGSYPYHESPGGEDRYAEEGGPQRFRPYDERYAGQGYSGREYYNGAPREQSEPEEEREPAR